MYGDLTFPVFVSSKVRRTSWIFNLAKYYFRDRSIWFIFFILKNTLLFQISGRYSPSKIVSDIPVFSPASFFYSLRLCRGSDGKVLNSISGTQLALSILVSNLLELAWCLWIPLPISCSPCCCAKDRFYFPALDPCTWCVNAVFCIINLPAPRKCSRAETFRSYNLTALIAGIFNLRRLFCACLSSKDWLDIFPLLKKLSPIQNLGASSTDGGTVVRCPQNVPWTLCVRNVVCLS